MPSEGTIPTVLISIIARSHNITLIISSSIMSSSKSKPQRTILPLVVPPLHDHKTTIIILHGRGSSAEKFAEPLLTHMVSPGDTVPATSTDSPADGLLKWKVNVRVVVILEWDTALNTLFTSHLFLP